MEWIKTKDQMPIADGRWLFFVFEDQIIKGSYESSPAGYFWFDALNIRYHPDRVHYWMPIPKLPKE